MEIYGLPLEEALANIEKNHELQKASEANDATELQRLINLWQASATNLFQPLNYAAKKGSVDTARYLLELGVRYEGTLVTAAVDAGSIPMLELLREYGWQVDENIGGQSAVTALNVACCKRNSEVAKYLLELGANPDLGPGGSAVYASAGDMYLWEDNRYNLYHAARTGCVETVDLLLEYGAADKSKACLLHAAVQSRSTKMIEHILALGVDVNEPDNAHRTGIVYGTPLHRAVASTHDLDAVKVLLAHGASISQPGTQECRDKTVVDMIMKDEIGEQIPDAIKDLIKEAACSKGMAPRT